MPENQTTTPTNTFPSTAIMPYRQWAQLLEWVHMADSHTHVQGHCQEGAAPACFTLNNQAPQKAQYNKPSI